MSSLSDPIEYVKNTPEQSAGRKDQKFELLFKRNQYLEKEYAKVIKQLRDEKEQAAEKARYLQTLNELQTKCSSLQDKHVKTVERLNEYHRQMQQAQGEVIALRRKISGTIGHVKAAVARKTRPGTRFVQATSPFEMLKEENKLLKWKLSVVEGYLAGMFAEELNEQPGENDDMDDR